MVHPKNVEHTLFRLCGTTTKREESNRTSKDSAKIKELSENFDLHPMTVQLESEDECNKILFFLQSKKVFSDHWERLTSSRLLLNVTKEVSGPLPSLEEGRNHISKNRKEDWNSRVFEFTKNFPDHVTSLNNLFHAGAFEALEQEESERFCEDHESVACYVEIPWIPKEWEGNLSTQGLERETRKEKDLRERESPRSRRGGDAERDQKEGGNEKKDHILESWVDLTSMEESNTISLDQKEIEFPEFVLPEQQECLKKALKNCQPGSSLVRAPSFFSLSSLRRVLTDQMLDDECMDFFMSALAEQSSYDCLALDVKSIGRQKYKERSTSSGLKNKNLQLKE